MSGQNEFLKTTLRRYRRVQILATMGALCNGKHRFHLALELSEGGLLFQSTTPYAIGDVLDIGILLSAQQTVVGEAEVAYALEPDGEHLFYGARFVNPSNELKDSIRRFIDRKR